MPFGLPCFLAASGLGGPFCCSCVSLDRAGRYPWYGGGAASSRQTNFLQVVPGGQCHHALHTVPRHGRRPDDGNHCCLVRGLQEAAAPAAPAGGAGWHPHPKRAVGGRTKPSPYKTPLHSRLQHSTPPSTALRGPGPSAPLPPPSPTMARAPRLALRGAAILLLALCCVDARCGGACRPATAVRHLQDGARGRGRRADPRRRGRAAVRVGGVRAPPAHVPHSACDSCLPCLQVSARCRRCRR